MIGLVLVGLAGVAICGVVWSLEKERERRRAVERELCGERRALRTTIAHLRVHVRAGARVDPFVETLIERERTECLESPDGRHHREMGRESCRHCRWVNVDFDVAEVTEDGEE